MSDLQRRALTRAISTAAGLGVDVQAVRDVICHGASASAGARLYAEQHPDAEDDPASVPDGVLWCCESAVYRGLAHCTCWEPVYDVDQAPARPDTLSGAMAEKCHDCAFRPGSPEREDPFMAEELYALPGNGAPFWCHQGMRQPARWRHATLGIEVPGDPADWRPPIVDGVPYLADGHAGNLCAGWLALRLAVMDRSDGDQTDRKAAGR